MLILQSCVDFKEFALFLRIQQFMRRIIIYKFQMENKNGSIHNTNSVKILANRPHAQGTLKQKRSLFKNSNTETSNSLPATKQNNYLGCLFTNKQNINLNRRSKQLSKYINLRAFSRDSGRKMKFIDNSMAIFQNSHTKYSGYNAANKKHDSSIVQRMGKNKSFLEFLNYQIDHIFRHIHTLKGLGFSQKKITKWMNNFLGKGSQTLRNIFLKSYINKKSLNNSIIYERQSSLSQVTLNMKDVVEKQIESETIFLLGEIKNFKNHIQQIVIKKAQLNLDEIFNIGSINPILKFNKANQFLTSTEITHFVKDLKEIEDRYGQLGSVSNVNRIMFKQILEAEQKFISKFYVNKNQQ